MGCSVPFKKEEVWGCTLKGGTVLPFRIGYWSSPLKTGVPLQQGILVLPFYKGELEGIYKRNLKHTYPIDRRCNAPPFYRADPTSGSGDPDIYVAAFALKPLAPFALRTVLCSRPCMFFPPGNGLSQGRDLSPPDGHGPINEM
jgi:hypothetical protein